MLTPAQIEYIQHLLSNNQEMTYRAIAVRAGVSRRTVSQVAKGRRQANHRQDAAWSDSLVYEPAANIGRCPTCGSRVVLPCVACRAQRYRRFQGWGKPCQFTTVARGQCHSLRQPA
jgi:transcriptional regulator with XRE-family HTH domain